jgi:peptidoglycan glycosyltransferase
MDQRIVRLFGLVFVMFTVLAGFTAWWAVLDADRLKGEQANKRPLFEAQRIKRGTIRAADGTVIAESNPVGRGEAKRFIREYPLGELFGHPVGYSFAEQGNSEFERYHDLELTGQKNEVNDFLDRLSGKSPAGNPMGTALDVGAQQTAVDLLAGRPGSVVAIEPSTGKVRVAASVPGYDPNRIPDFLKDLNTDPAAPLLDRSTQGQYPPGSTFKVVTAAAALDSGVIDSSTLIDSPSTIDVQGNPLSNFGGAAFGPIAIETALTRSANTFFARLGEQTGTGTMFEYMDRFGFGSRPPIDLPPDELSLSGVFSGGDLVRPEDGVDVGRIAIGQERLLVTPLQMAQVVSAVANRGVLMKPRIWTSVRDRDGRVLSRMKPERQSEVITPETAAELTQAMTSVVREGTGTAAALSGIDVAGKTGTAEVPGRSECSGLPNQAWFIGFAPADRPKVAVAATVECTTGTGGDVAAPIAAGVIQELLAE